MHQIEAVCIREVNLNRVTVMKENNDKRRSGSSLKRMFSKLAEAV